MKKMEKLLVLFGLLLVFSISTVTFAKQYAYGTAKVTQYDYNKYYGFNMNFQTVKFTTVPSGSYVYKYTYKKVGSGWNYERYHQTHHYYNPYTYGYY